MSDWREREAAVFAEALRLPAEQRGAYLEQACAGEEELRRRIEELLRASERVGDFLEESPHPRGILNGRGEALGEKPGDRIGRYKLLQQIGEGGCGVVFMAEQDEPVRRRVALKIIKPGMDTRNVIARFEAERQALALMDHPNIAKVFDAGATESGRPYFVMELIRGIRITDYCDQNALTTADRLTLFAQVCRAVQHAHQKGIIHRDIKPSNVLVTKTLEGDDLPVVIDFGIAKATTNQRLTDKTLFTAFEMLIGTPAYMSPEQAAFAQVDVDTRSDIYSLGVLLYELLTGSTPFDAGRLLEAGLDEVRRVIREQEPARPSTRLSTMAADDLTTVARHRRSEPPLLIRSVRGDLDWIVMKALEKDRTRRYETANGLALDVQRFLAQETVLARPPSRLYRLQKAFLRNQLLFSAIGIIAVLLIASLVVVGVAWTKEREALRKSQRDELKSRQVTQFLKSMLEGVGPSVARGRDTAMLREILDKTSEQLGRQMGEHPAMEAEMRSLIARLHVEVGNYEGAEAMAQAALALWRSTTGSESAETASALQDLGMALWKLRKLAEAETAYREALAIRQRLHGNQHADVAATLNQLGAVYRRQQRLAEAESLTRQGLAIRRQQFGNEHLDVADSLRNLGIVLRDRGMQAEAEAAVREMLAIRRRLLDGDHPLVASALADLAWVLGGESEEAAALETEAFGIQHQVLGDRHPEVAKSIYIQGERLRRRGNLGESHAVLNAALSIQRQLLGNDHPDVVATLQGLGATLEQDGQWSGAEAAYREVVSSRRRQAGEESTPPLDVVEGLVRVLVAQAKHAEAETVLNEALSPALIRQRSSTGLLVLKVDLLGRLGRWREAVDHASRLIEYQPQEHYRFHTLASLLAAVGDRSAYQRLCHQILARFVDTTDSYVAERMAGACLLLPDPGVDFGRVDRLTEKALAHDVPTTPMPYSEAVKALSEYRRGRFESAVEWATKTLSSGDAFSRTQAHAVLAMARHQLGQEDQARASLAQGIAVSNEIVPGRDAGRIRGSWVAWLIGRVLIEEACTRIFGAPTGVLSNTP